MLSEVNALYLMTCHLPQISGLFFWRQVFVVPSLINFALVYLRALESLHKTGSFYPERRNHLFFLFIFFFFIFNYWVWKIFKTVFRNYTYFFFFYQAQPTLKNKVKEEKNVTININIFASFFLFLFFY